MLKRTKSSDFIEKLDSKSLNRLIAYFYSLKPNVKSPKPQDQDRFDQLIRIQAILDILFELYCNNEDASEIEFEAYTRLMTTLNLFSRDNLTPEIQHKAKSILELFL